MPDWLIPRDLGGRAAVLDFLISLVGFAFTLYGIRKARTAAEQAKAAASDARERVRLFETVVDFSAAIAMLEEIKRLHREEAWAALPDRYMAMRKLLIQLRHSGLSLSSEQNVVIQRALANLKDIENQIEKTLNENSGPKVSRLNMLISTDIEGLVMVLTQIKNKPAGDLL